MNSELKWVLVRGGLCLFGDRGKPITIADLYWSATLITRSIVGGNDDLPGVPVTGISHSEAGAIASSMGARLPRSSEWEWMASGPERRIFPWGFQAWTPDFANLKASLLNHPTAVGRFPLGATPEGVLDAAGNVWEWTASVTIGEGAVIRGGSYRSSTLHVRTTFINIAPTELRSRGIGVRVVRDP